MSGIEPIIAAEAAAATTAAASTTAAAATAEIVAAEAAAAAAAEAAAAEAARQAALNAFASSAGDALAAESLGATALEGASAAQSLQYLDPQYAAQNNMFGPNIEFMPTEAGQDVVLRSGAETTNEALAKAAENTLEQQAFENFLRYGPEADMPGATARSIQAGFKNAPLNTLRSLPQYMGSSPYAPGPKEAFQMRNLLSSEQQGQRTNVAPPMLNKGRDVNLAAPIAGLLGGMQMPRRRRLSLI